jgi:hypothetical protein
MLPRYLAEIPHHYWNAQTQTFVAEIKAGGVVVERYAIPRHVFFAIHADMARAIQESDRARQSAEIVPLKEAEG